jgi:hypothetical protein
LPAGQMPSDNVPAEKNETFKNVEFSDVFLLSRIKLEKNEAFKNVDQGRRDKIQSGLKIWQL